MTTIVMGDVNAVFTLECAHRRHLLVARATERTIFVDQRAPHPSHKDDWRRIHLMTLSFSVFCNFETCMSIRRPSKCSDFCQMLFTISTGKSGSTLVGEFWGGCLDGVSGTLGFPHRTPSFAHAHHDAARCCGRKSDALAAASCWEGGQFTITFSTRSVRLLRRVQALEARDFASKQTMSK